MTKKYLTPAEFLAIVGDLTLDPTFFPMSQDTYNEGAVANSIVKTGRSKDLCMAAINLACIGYGNKRYGMFKCKEAIVDLAKLFAETGVMTNVPKDAKLKETDLTPQRLCRAFRTQIREYIRANKQETYLYRKYSNHEPQYFDIMFRGSEYLDDLSPEQCEYLLGVYQSMDSKLNINITERVRRVFQAKGYIARRVQGLD
jgi:hypothetical protein